ncbi:MAG: M20/M25/M40 family metallo-hydrolase [Desulfosarcina sp.]|nr:M20/M25/M40 family metallo-hydrolase [Desulfobacterales bacterium]
MRSYLDQLDTCSRKLREIKETIIANIVFLGQIPAPTFHEKRLSIKFLDRLVESEVDECTTDGYQNPIGIIRGRDSSRDPIIVVAHLDTSFGKDVDHNFTITENMIQGPGVLDNSVGVGMIASLPMIFKYLDLRFTSDIILAGVIQSLGKGNLRGIRHLVKTWPSKIRAAVCIEGVELGRLNYYSDGMIRCEITCNIHTQKGVEYRFKPNAILVLHEVINQILKIRLPQKPRSRVIIGKIKGGHKHGVIAYDATLGLEIQSDADRMVKSLFNDIKDIVTGISHEFGVEIKLNTISNISAARLKYNHPLVKAAGEVMRRLDLPIVGDPSESELSIFLSKKIAAVTLGLTQGDNYHQPNSRMEIEPMFKGIAQVIGTIQAIDSGVCDE